MFACLQAVAQCDCSTELNAILSAIDDGSGGNLLGDNDSIIEHLGDIEGALWGQSGPNYGSTTPIVPLLTDHIPNMQQDIATMSNIIQNNESGIGDWFGWKSDQLLSDTYNLVEDVDVIRQALDFGSYSSPNSNLDFGESSSTPSLQYAKPGSLGAENTGTTENPVWNFNSTERASELTNPARTTVDTSTGLGQLHQDIKDGLDFDAVSGLPMDPLVLTFDFSKLHASYGSTIVIDTASSELAGPVAMIRTFLGMTAHMLMLLGIIKVLPMAIP